MNTDKSNVSLQDIMGVWIHSHEEDPRDDSLCRVFRPADWSFGPSRGRQGFQLREGNDALIHGIGPADGSVEVQAEWRIEAGNVLIIQEPGGATHRLRIEECGPDRLILREILGSS